MRGAATSRRPRPERRRRVCALSLVVSALARLRSPPRPAAPTARAAARMPCGVSHHRGRASHRRAPLFTWRTRSNIARLVRRSLARRIGADAARRTRHRAGTATRGRPRSRSPAGSGAPVGARHDDELVRHARRSLRSDSRSGCTSRSTRRIGRSRSSRTGRRFRPRGEPERPSVADPARRRLVRVLRADAAARARPVLRAAPVLPARGKPGRHSRRAARADRRARRHVQRDRRAARDHDVRNLFQGRARRSCGSPMIQRACRCSSNRACRSARSICI